MLLISYPYCGRHNLSTSPLPPPPSCANMHMFLNFPQLLIFNILLQTLKYTEAGNLFQVSLPLSQTDLEKETREAYFTNKREFYISNMSLPTLHREIVLNTKWESVA